MNWKIHKDRKSKSYVANPRCKDWAGFSTACAGLLEKFCSTVEQYYEPEKWDRFFVEAWGDAGRLITYPGKRGESRSAWKVSFELRCDFVRKQYEKLPDPGSNPEDFEIACLVLNGRFIAAFDMAARRKEIKKMIKDLNRRNEFKIMVQTADDEDSAVQLFL